jgi:Trp operon repressor
VGGGLIRSLGGWSQVRSAGSKGAGKGDERILGSPQFVLQVLAEAEERQRKQIRAPEKSIDEMIEQECAQRELSSQELRNGGRRPKATAARMFIAYRALAELGPSAAEAARRLGVAASTITRAVAKNENGIK